MIGVSSPLCKGLQTKSNHIGLGHFQVGRYRCRSLIIEGLYTLWKLYRSPTNPKLPTCSFL